MAPPQRVRNGASQFGAPMKVFFIATLVWLLVAAPCAEAKSKRSKRRKSAAPNSIWTETDIIAAMVESIACSKNRRASPAQCMKQNPMVQAFEDGKVPDTEESTAAIVRAVYCGARECSAERERDWRHDMDVLREVGHATPGTMLYQEVFLDQDVKPLVIEKKFTDRLPDGTHFGFWLWENRIIKYQAANLVIRPFPKADRRASTPVAESTEVDAGEVMDVYSYASFKGLGPMQQTHNFGGVPVHLSSMEHDGSETMLPDIRAHLRKMEPEWMKLPIRDWNDKNGTAFNSTSARYDQFNVMSAANPEDPSYDPIMVKFKQFVKAGVVNFLESMAEMPEFHTESEYWTGTINAVQPFPLYIMCWVNNYYATDGSNNALHWHVHQWPLQGYLSIDSESSSTLFRSNVQPDKKWRFEHTNGMVRAARLPMFFSPPLMKH